MPSIPCRRFENAASSSAGTPSISRTGRRPGLARLARSVNSTPSRVRSSSSIRVLYRSDTDTAAANSGRPSKDRHVPSGPWTLFETATWVCRSGSPARESQ